MGAISHRLANAFTVFHHAELKLWAANEIQKQSRNRDVHAQMKTMEICLQGKLHKLSRGDWAVRFPRVHTMVHLFSNGKKKPHLLVYGQHPQFSCNTEMICQPRLCSNIQTPGSFTSISATVKLLDCLHDLFPKSPISSTEGMLVAFRGLIQWAESSVALPSLSESSDSLWG